MNELIEAIKAKLGEDVITEEMATDLQASIDVLVNEQVQTKLTEKEQELEESTAKEMSEFKDSLIESVDNYIEYAADEYLKENEIAIEAGSKVQAAEKIIESVKGVFKEVGIEIPEEEVDRFKELESKLEETEEKLNSKLEEVIEAKKQQFEFEKAISFMKKTEQLSEAKVDEVHDLMEGLEYKDITDFEKKVDIVIEKVTKVYKQEDSEFDELEESTDPDKKVSSIDKYLER